MRLNKVIHWLFQKKSSTSEKSVSPDYKYYAFISYKHRDGECFVADSRWAKRLKIELGMMHLDTPPIDHDSIIDDYDNTISQVFRDDDNLSGGKLTEAIKKALKESKVLVIILSKEMVADQNRMDAAHRDAMAKLDERLNAGEITQEEYEKLLKNVPRAWLHEEFDLFMKLHCDNMDNVCLVNVEGEPISTRNRDLIPEYLLDKIDDNKRIVSPFENFSESQYGKKKEWGKDEDYFVERTAAAIAGHIFGLNVEEFWSYRQKQKQAEKLKKLVAGVIAVLLVSVFVFSLILNWNRRKEEQAIRLMDRAQSMVQKGDRQKAMMLARAAYDKAPHSSTITDFMRQFQTESGTKPFTLLRHECFVNPSRNEVVYYDYQGNKSLYVLDGKDFSTKIVFRNADYLNGVYFDSIGEMMLIAGADSIKVYNFNRNTFYKGIPYRGEMGNELGTSFAFSGDYLLRVWKDSSVVNHLPSGRQTVIRENNFDKTFVKDGLINCVRISKDTVSVYQFDPAQLSFYPVKIYSLSHEFKYSEYFEISPSSGNMAFLTSEENIYYIGADGSHHELYFSEGYNDLKFNQDGSCLLAVKTDNNGNLKIHVWKNGQYVKELYYSTDKTTQNVFWGNDEDIVVVSEGKIIVSNIRDSYKYELDTRINMQYNSRYHSWHKVTPTDDALYYVNNTYDNQKNEYIGLLKFKYPDWQGFGQKAQIDPFESDFWKQFPRYNSSVDHHFEPSRQLGFMADSCGIDVVHVEQGNVARLSYPSGPFPDHWSNQKFFRDSEGKDLICLRRLFYPNDISSMKGDTEIIRIDLETLSITSSTRMPDFLYLFGIVTEGKLLISDEESLYILDANSLQKLAKIDVYEPRTDELINISNHRYLLPTIGRDFYELDLHKYRISPSRLQFKSAGWRSTEFDNHYLLVQTSYSSGKMVYDVKNNQGVYFPDELESVQDISKGMITINYHSVDNDYFMSRTYIRPILSDEQVSTLVDSLIGKRTLTETDLWELSY